MSIDNEESFDEKWKKCRKENLKGTIQLKQLYERHIIDIENKNSRDYIQCAKNIKELDNIIKSSEKELQ